MAFANNFSLSPSGRERKGGIKKLLVKGITGIDMYHKAKGVWLRPGTLITRRDVKVSIGFLRPWYLLFEHAGWKIGREGMAWQPQAQGCGEILHLLWLDSVRSKIRQPHLQGKIFLWGNMIGVLIVAHKTYPFREFWTYHPLFEQVLRRGRSKNPKPASPR